MSTRRSPRSLLFFVVAAILAGALALVACGGDDAEGDDTTGDDTTIDANPGTPDAPVTDTPDAAPPGTPDASTPAASTVITCGADTCTRASEVCCFTAPKPFKEECAPKGQTCPGNKLPSACDGPEDCNAGEVCCAGAGQGPVCKASGMCTGIVLQLCHTKADCGASQTCGTSEFSPWGVCRNM